MEYTLRWPLPVGDPGTVSHFQLFLGITGDRVSCTGRVSTRVARTGFHRGNSITLKRCTATEIKGVVHNKLDWCSVCDGQPQDYGSTRLLLLQRQILHWICPAKTSLSESTFATAVELMRFSVHKQRSVYCDYSCGVRMEDSMLSRCYGPCGGGSPLLIIACPRALNPDRPRFTPLTRGVPYVPLHRAT